MGSFSKFSVTFVQYRIASFVLTTLDVRNYLGAFPVNSFAICNTIVWKAMDL